jgi:hypothetical protein
MAPTHENLQGLGAELPSGRRISTSTHGPFRADCRIKASPEAAREARARLPETCAARDDLLTVLTELVANAAEHGEAAKPLSSFSIQTKASAAPWSTAARP